MFAVFLLAQDLSAADVVRLKGKFPSDSLFCSCKRRRVLKRMSMSLMCC